MSGRKNAADQGGREVGREDGSRDAREDDRAGGRDVGREDQCERESQSAASQARLDSGGRDVGLDSLNYQDSRDAGRHDEETGRDNNNAGRDDLVADLAADEASAGERAGGENRGRQKSDRETAEHEACHKKSGGRKSISHQSDGKERSGRKASGEKLRAKTKLRIMQGSASEKTEKGKRQQSCRGNYRKRHDDVTPPGEVRQDEVDLKALRRMLTWQLELLNRLQVLTLSALEVVGDKGE